MELKKSGAEIFIPDGVSLAEAFRRTTHMGIGGHQDDLEIMAHHGVLECFHNGDNWFFGVTVTNGGGSPRDDLYADYTDEDMQKVRRAEQKKAAVVGEYSAVALLDYPSSELKDGRNPGPKEDLKQLIDAGRPRIIYTHNPADKHDTHVAAAIRVIQALRELPRDVHPGKLYGCEVWRDLDWMTDEDKVAFTVDAHENLAASLLGIYDSQICGGKRYDLATMGRRRANATYHASHGLDVSTALIFAMDLKPLIDDAGLDIDGYTQEYIRHFATDVSARIQKLL